MPEAMPAKVDGHSKLIYGPPWYVHRPIAPLRWALPMAHPPSYPPPRHLLGSLNAPSGQSGYPSSLVAVNNLATLPSSPPVAPTSTHSTSSTAGVISKEFVERKPFTSLTTCFSHRQGTWFSVLLWSCAE